MPSNDELLVLILTILDDAKGKQIKVINVIDKSSVTDYMVIATGTSSTHIKALATHVMTRVKQQGVQPLGVEGEQDKEWVLVDLGDIIVHLMLAKTREFYQLEKIWEPDFELDNTPVSVQES